jgi:hypothetical protein
MADNVLPAATAPVKATNNAGRIAASFAFGLLRKLILCAARGFRLIAVLAWLLFLSFCENNKRLRSMSCHSMWFFIGFFQCRTFLS